jgi:Asp-tRNA(Asn)/Glu-tRNA(Gln) amidotransferase A subunit family amidase
MQKAVETTARLAASAGATVTEIDQPPFLDEADAAHGTINRYEAFRALAYEYDHHRDTLGPAVRKLLDEAAETTADDYDSARRTAKRARQAFADFMADTDVILTASATGAAPRGFASTGSPAFNRVWTLLGAPCINVPGLMSGSGLPLGVQVIGRFGRDRVALGAAAFIARAIPQM